MSKIKLFTKDTSVTYQKALENAVKVLEVFVDVQRVSIDAREVPRRNLTAMNMNLFADFTGLNWSFNNYETIRLYDENGIVVDIITINDLYNTLKGEL